MVGSRGFVIGSARVGSGRRGFDSPFPHRIRGRQWRSLRPKIGCRLSQGSHGGSVVSGYMRDDGAREVFANPDAPIALVAEPAGAAVETADGVRVSGRWRFASGVTHANWIVLGCIMMDGGQPRMTEHGPQVLHVFMPTRDVTIHDTWHVSGLCGTGSNDVSCEDVAVPASRVLSLFDPTGYRPEPLYQMPVLSQVAPGVAVDESAPNFCATKGS